MSQGKVISCRAAVCWAPGEKLKIEEIQVDPPKRGEVRIRIVATGIVREQFVFDEDIFVQKCFSVSLLVSL